MSRAPARPKALAPLPKPTLAMLLQQPDTSIDEEPTVRESDLPHHFKNGQGKHTPANQPGTDNQSAPAKPAGQSSAAKPVKPTDIQLAKAIEILKHWSTYKTELARNESSSTGSPAASAAASNAAP